MNPIARLIYRRETEFWKDNSSDELWRQILTGQAFVGKVGHEGVTDFTVLGDAANVTARLSSSARAGEILISEAAAAAAHWRTDDLETRTLELKGHSEPMKVWVQRIAPARE